MTQKPIIERLLWEELTEAQQKEFIRMMNHAGDRDRYTDHLHLYQIRDGKNYGWMCFCRELEIKRRSKIFKKR